MVIVCPNLSNKEVAREFQELVDATSENAAYHIWSMNNGYNIDTAPNGEPSILFQTLLDQFGGDRKKAIAEKAKTYSNSFVKWFGDWTLSDKTDVSKVVDKNGEPLVVYHGGSNTNVFDTTGRKGRGAGIQKGITGTYFTTSKTNARSYEDIYTYKNSDQWIDMAEYANSDAITEEEKNQIDKRWEIEKPATRGFYLNIRNPLYTQYAKQDDGYAQKNSDTSDYDGQHIVISDKDYEEYVATNPNQIKSIQNKGDFSRKNNDVYGEDVSESQMYQTFIDYNNDKKSAVQQSVTKHMQQNPDATIEEVNDVVSETEEQFNQQQQKSIAQRTKETLIEAYGLVAHVDENGRVVYEGPDVIVQFVQYLEDELGEHEGWYDYNSLSNAAHNVIKIAMNGNSFATFKHELAHHYIRMFWGTPLIQNALGAVYKEGMTMQELEEALVDEITSRTGVLFNDDVEQKTFYTKFWEKFSEMLAKAFNIKNKTYKEMLLNNTAKAYMLNEQQKANPKYKEKFQMHNGRMYMDKYTKRKKEAREKKKQQAFKSHYQFTNSERRDQRVVKTIVDEAVRRKRSMQNYKDITDKEVVALNVFEQDVLEFVEALKQQREMEVQKLKAIGKSESYARRMSGDSSKELQMNVDIIGKFIDNAEKELGVAVNRFRSAKSAMFMKVTIKTEEDPTTGDINTTYVNASEYGVDPNVSQKDFSFEELSRLGRDLISYYTDIYSDINQMLENRTVNKLYTEEQLQLIKDRLETIKSLVDEVSALYKEGLYERCVQFVDQYVENYSKNHPGVLDEEHVERLKINFHKWIDGQFDLGMGSRFSVHYLAENWLGIAEWSQSPIIRMMHQIIFDNNSQNEEDVIKRKNELYSARERAKKALMKKFSFKSLFTTFDKMFMEYDENGFPTGNFLSKVNKGKFYRKRSVFIDELLYSKGGIEDKIREAIGDPNYELDVNPNGMPIFPDDERCENIEIEYLVKYNDFLSENCERQYTPQYYKERLRILCNLDKDMQPTDDSSTKALHAQNEIQSEIDKILKPCIIKGRPHTELLEPDQIYALQQLENQRTLLSSPYDSYGRKRQEGTDEYYVYQRLKAWKDFLKDKNIVYEIDKESFEESLEKSKNKKQFRRLNTYRKIDSRFWDIFSDHLGRVEDAELEELQWQRTQLLSILKSRGLSKPNLDIVWDEVNGRIKPEWEEFFQNLKELDTKIKNRRIKLSKGKKTSAKDAEFIDSMIDRRPALKDKDTWYQHMSEAIKKRHYSTKAPGAKTKAEEEIKRLLRYVDKNGKSHELSIFNVTYPKQARLKDSEGEFSTIVREPIRAYSIINVEKSDENWVNKNFDRESDEVVQPKMSKYKDERYEKILGDGAPKEVKEYYDLLKSTMRDAYANISFLGKYDDMLPQTCARASSILSRFSWRFWKSIPFIIKREFDVTENDTDINEVVFKQRKDNTITGAIPVRYIKRLDDPRFVNGDIMRSVLQFYAMSKNYSSMQNVAPIFTSLHEQMLKSGSDEQAKVAKGFIHRQVYGKTKTGIPDGVLTKTVKRLLKGLQITRAASVIGLLGFGLTAGTVATLDALLSFIANVSTRRNTGLSDTISALWIMTKSIPQLIVNAGGIKKSKAGYGIVNTMLEHFGFDNVLGTIKNSDKNQVYRALLNDGYSGIAFLPFSLGEKFINTVTLISSLNAHRLYRGEFLSREAFFRKANEDGLTRSQAIKLWFKAGRLYNAYTIDKQGNLVPKTKTKVGLALASMSKESREALENSIRSRNKSKAASFNALVLSSETSQLQTNILFNWISMMRNFLIIGFWERFSKLNDFYEYDSDEMSEGEKEQMRADQANYSGGLNFMTGEITTGRFRGALRTVFARDNGKHSALGRMQKNIADILKYFYKTQIARNDKYDVRKELKLSEADLNGFNLACAELTIITLSMIASGWFHNKYAGDHDDDYWFQLIDLILLRMPIERLTLWNPDTIMELVRSITAGKTVLDRFVFGSILKQAIKDYKEHDFNYSDYERVKSGSFKGETALYRDALKLTSFLGTYNLYRNTHTNALRESKKFYTKLGDVNPASLLWKSKKELEAEKQSQEQFEPADIYGGGFSY